MRPLLFPGSVTGLEMHSIPVSETSRVIGARISKLHTPSGNRRQQQVRISWQKRTLKLGVCDVLAILSPLMTASSKPTEQNWYHTSSLPSLAYDALPNHQDDCDSIISYSKITVENRNDFYDRSLTSRRYALVGVVCSCIVSCCCIIAGTVIMASLRGSNGAIPTGLNSNLQKEMLVLILNLIVTLCTESTGFVHNIALRSALASECRLRFNTNLRLLTAARGWRNPNGALLNGITAILLIISYNSASLVILFLDNSNDTTGKEFYVYIAGLPLLLLGVALLLQVMIALSGLRAVKILTWSSSSFDLTAAMVHHTQLTPAPFRCMRGVSDMDVDEGPSKPSESQPSAWHAHPSIRKVVISLWALVVACAGWAMLVMFVSDMFDGGMLPSPALSSESWSFFPSEQYSNALVYGIPLSGGVNVQWWILSFVNLAVVQGPLTIGLHCSELIANVIRDERHWKSATGRKGLRMATNPLKSLFANPLSLVLFVAKPALHWMFGLSFTLLASGGNQTLEMVGIYMFTAQIWNLCLALFIFACFFTLIALLRPHSPQPAAYGHLQTLANLVDEWSPVIWWGHKEDSASYCHAGTSDHSLPPVKMDCVYAARLGSMDLEPSH